MPFNNNPFSNLFTPKPATNRPGSTPSTASKPTTATTPQDHRKSHLSRSSHTLLTAGAPSAAASLGHILQKSSEKNDTPNAIAGQKRKHNDTENDQAPGHTAYCAGCGIPSVPGWTFNVQVVDAGAKRRGRGMGGPDGEGKNNVKHRRSSKRRKPEWDARKAEKRREMTKRQGSKAGANDAHADTVRRKRLARDEHNQRHKRTARSAGTRSTQQPPASQQPPLPPKLLTRTCTRCPTHTTTTVPHPGTAAQTKELNKSRKPKGGAPVLGGAVSRSKKAKERKRERGAGVLGRV